MNKGVEKRKRAYVCIISLRATSSEVAAKKEQNVSSLDPQDHSTCLYTYIHTHTHVCVA